ncbi:hypothetical protein D3C72_1945700 [compost metagenome]
MVLWLSVVTLASRSASSSSTACGLHRRKPVSLSMAARSDRWGSAKFPCRGGVRNPIMMNRAAAPWRAMAAAF